MFSWTDQLRRAVFDKRRIGEHLAKRRELERREVAAFFVRVMSPALQDLKNEWERLGRTVLVYRESAVFHITVWHERSVEFTYSVAACRRRRPTRIYGDVCAAATSYAVTPQKVYSLREIRRTNQQKFARHIVSQYRRQIVAR